MARCLIVGCGCRGTALARELIGLGHSVRATTRDERRGATIEASGAEALIADPDRVATLAAALEQVTVACLLLGSASGPSERLSALHGPRLEMLLTRMRDTTVRGIMYEGAGTAPAALLAAGAQLVRGFCADSRIPCAIVTADPSDHDGWLADTIDAVVGLLAPP